MSFRLSVPSFSFRAVRHPTMPENQEFVRVHSYQSKMVIRPHKSFDEVRISLTKALVLWWCDNKSDLIWIRNLLCVSLSVVVLVCSLELVILSQQNGFDYLLTYSDDPQTVFPRYCVSWMVSSGEPSVLCTLSIWTVKTFIDRFF